MLVELITKNAGSEQRHYPYYPSPSKVGQCVRALTYHAIGVTPDPFPDRAMLIFEDGNWHEELVKDHIRKTVFELIEFKGSNQRIEIAKINGKKMTGEIDGLLKDPLGTLYLLELKSINHFGFERLEDKPEPQHERQSNLYMHGLISAGMEVRKGVILYKNKNTAAMKEFVIDYSEEQARADIDLFFQIAAWASERKVPPRPYDRDKDWQCNYCRWASTCYENYQGEFEALTEDAELEPEIENLFKYYLEVSGHRLSAEKEEEELKEQIRTLLKEKGARGGRVGPYVAKRTLQERRSIDKSLIPKDILPQVEKVTVSEKLTIRKVKEETA